jgi:hypothetical protein
MADTPDWLKPSAADIEVGGTSDDFDEPSPTSQTTSNDNNKASGGDSPDSSRRSFSCSCGAVMVLMISTAFLALFVYSATVSRNDVDGLQWMLFYALSAALAAMFMVHYMCCFPEKAIYVLAFAMSVWSIVYIVIYALKFKDTPKGGEKGGGDNDNQTLRQELGYDMGGSALVLLSALYHVFMVKCCVNKNKPE